MISFLKRGQKRQVWEPLSCRLMNPWSSGKPGSLNQSHFHKPHTSSPEAGVDIINNLRCSLIMMALQLGPATLGARSHLSQLPPKGPFHGPTTLVFLGRSLRGRRESSQVALERIFTHTHQRELSGANFLPRMSFENEFPISGHEATKMLPFADSQWQGAGLRAYVPQANNNFYWITL